VRKTSLPSIDTSFSSRNFVLSDAFGASVTRIQSNHNKPLEALSLQKHGRITQPSLTAKVTHLHA